MRIACAAIFLFILAPLVAADQAPFCASTIREFQVLLGDPVFPRHWAEVSMNDGKPLVVSILERNGLFQLEFMKTGEGLWAVISGVVCRKGGDFEVKVEKEQIRLGPAASWMLTLALANGGVFTLRRRQSDHLQISTDGWSGSFVPARMD